MNDMSRPSRVSGGVSTITPENPRCPYCLRERDPDNIVFVEWAENNCTSWEFCPANFGQPT